MTAHLLDVGNPSSLHASGRQARRIVEESRETIAQALDCRPGEVVFTSGGTEADNLALKGIYWARRAADPARTRILTTAVEHHAVLDPLHWLAEREGARVELLPVDRQARVDVAALRESVERDPTSVGLISVMWANNEVGTLEPIDEVVAIAAEHGIPVHTDAVQAVGAVPVDFAASGVDALTLTGHKVGGPYGVGALVVRREVDVTALVHGGGQERDIRSGTIDTPAIAGLAAAVELSVKQQAEHAARVSVLRDRLVSGVLDAVPNAVANGDPVRRLPGNAHLTFPGCEGDSLLMLLDARGIECSTGSACSAGVPQASHVLLAMGYSDEEARSSLRFSLGHTSTAADVDALLEAIGPVVERARAAKAP
jgi:cysteine desulfurase